MQQKLASINIHYEKNMENADRIIRIIIAAIIGVLYFKNVISRTVAIILITMAIIFTLTSIFSIKTGSIK
ncbi:MAG: YgaP-like transmembrane domain [Polaribacter sp.]|uniref:YgaP-like transmembrane domain n=1 Tax=Polaribacter sp. TaxID=1920175 RepID=UPI0032631D2E